MKRCVVSPRQQSRWLAGDAICAKFFQIFPSFKHRKNDTERYWSSAEKWKYYKNAYWASHDFLLIGCMTLASNNTCICSLQPAACKTEQTSCTLGVVWSYRSRSMTCNVKKDREVNKSAFKTVTYHSHSPNVSIVLKAQSAKNFRGVLSPQAPDARRPCGWQRQSVKLSSLPETATFSSCSKVSAVSPFAEISLLLLMANNRSC